MGKIHGWSDKQKGLIDLVFRQEIPKPKEFVKVFAHGGRGAGKSRAMLYIIDEICNNTIGMNFLVTRRSFESIRLDTFNILKFDPGILDASKGKWIDKGKTFLYHKTGSRMHFEHMERSDSLLGPTYGGIYVEQIELCNEDDFRLLNATLRQFSVNHEYWEKYKTQIENHEIRLKEYSRP